MQGAETAGHTAGLPQASATIPGAGGPGAHVSPPTDSRDSACWDPWEGDESSSQRRCQGWP